MRIFQLSFLGVLIVLIALIDFHPEVYAEQLDSSVKECIEDPTKCSDSKATIKDEDAETDTQTAIVQEEASVGLNGWDFLKMILATLFVIALLYFMLRFINKRNNTYRSTQLVENLGGTALGGNRSVQVIKIGERLLIVGVGESIQLLKEIENGKEVNQLIEDYNNKMEQLVQPSDIVTKVMNLAKNNSMKKSEGEAFSSVLQKQLEELSKGRKKMLNEMEKKGSDKNE